MRVLNKRAGGMMDARMSIGLVRMRGLPVCGFLVEVNDTAEVLAFSTKDVEAQIRQYEGSQCKPFDPTGKTVSEIRAAGEAMIAFADNVDSLRRDLQRLSRTPGIPESDDNALAVLYRQTHGTINWNELVERMEAQPDQQRGATPREPATPPEADRRRQL